MTHSDDNDVLDTATGRPRLLSEQCSTCIFRPGNPMNLRPGYLKEIVEANVAAGAGLTCHQTLAAHPGEAPPSWCRGFYDAYGDAVAAVRFARAVMGGVTEVEPPAGE